jgi:TolB-like protein
MARRMRTVPAIAVLAVVMLAAGAAEARVRLAVADFEVSGGDSPALALQLQDGFVQGLVRAGVQVFDTVDTTKKLEGHPELQHCDTSACLKAIGQQLDVRYVVRVRVEVAGNSYKTVARVFSTEGSAPASLPISTKSKTCDVCTVVEARENLVRLADMLRPQIEEPAAAAPATPVAPSAKPPSTTMPIVAAMAGALSVAVGFAILGSNGSCTGTACSENRTRSAVGGGLVGAGAAIAVMGTYVTIVRSRGGEPVTGVAVTVPF